MFNLKSLLNNCLRKKTPCESEAVVRTSPPKTANKVRSGAQSLGLWKNGPLQARHIHISWDLVSRSRGTKAGPVQTQDWGIQDCSVEFRSFYQHTAAPPYRRRKFGPGDSPNAWGANPRLVQRIERSKHGIASISPETAFVVRLPLGGDRESGTGTGRL